MRHTLDGSRRRDGDVVALTWAVIVSWLLAVAVPAGVLVLLSHAPDTSPPRTLLILGGACGVFAIPAAAATVVLIVIRVRQRRSATTG
ncbi:hypothetical protein [Frondihabitans sp. VKM Ac-2883]|uniref:hypothetical protein n=1 Tax=Frondihabitans sp. VKM Ac-2883 TaxID=2783823 RepID=UPI00188B9E9C|nr:hypothetical protein [Frondihabitans sp. VKM Ac-2883]MBF4575044.1 hypothetical protein [Frondihabitans sp. VKM Ac-2883]